MNPSSGADRTSPRLAPSSDLIQPADIELAITDQLFARHRMPQLMSMLAGSTMLLLLWAQGAGTLLLPLFAAFALACASCQLLQHRYSQADAHARRTGRWRAGLILTTGLCGGSMAAAACALLPLAPPLQQALCMSLVTATSIIAASSHAICPRVHLTFTLASLLPLSIAMLEREDAWLQQWGLFSLLLLLTQLLHGWLNHRIRLHNLISELENRALLRQQEHSRRMSDALNQELAREIFERQSIEEELLATKWQLESKVRERQKALTASQQALQREAHNRLYLAQHDQLTGLTNRGLLMQRLADASERLRRRDDGSSLVLLLIDIDRFKWINESLGHDVADEVLRLVAHRLQECTSSGATLSRMAVDEFAILLDPAPARSELEQLAGRLLAHLRQPLQLGEHQLRLSASLGIALYPGHCENDDELIGCANSAVRHVKQLGGNHFAFYSETLHAHTHERLLLEAQLDKALENDQLVVYYQPRLNLHGNRVQGAEALVRWIHPELGMVSPASFIGLAEETGQINAIGAFVLRQACLQARQWLDAGHPLLRVSVNISTHQLRHGDFIEQVRQVLQDTGLPAHLLELELTESQLSVDLEVLVEHFRHLRQLGVRLAIDDFGTGYSSLGYLKQLPVDVLKIDRTFIRELGGQAGDGDAAITRAIIAMAHSLGLEVVAEGVEEPAQLDFLRANQCDEIQGFLFSRPIPSSEFDTLLDRAA